MGLIRHRTTFEARQHERGRLRRMAAAGLALATAATAVPLLLTAAPASAMSGKGMAVGAYATGGTSELNSIESQLGKKFDVDHEYIKFGQESITQYIAGDRGKRIPYVNMSLNCGCRSSKNGNKAVRNYWKAIVNHQYDTWLKAQAAAVKAWGGTFYITWQHEPEHTYGWEGTPADYQAAWKYIVAYFKFSGASNAVFVTSFLPTSFHGTSPKVNQFWPGIDGLIAGSTGYNWACSAHTGNQPGCAKTWKQFATVFGPANAWANAHHVNWWVTETGTAEDPLRKPPPPGPDAKAQWINALQQTADSAGWSRLTGVMFFFGSRSHDLFLPNTSPQSLDAFRFMMNEWAG